MSINYGDRLSIRVFQNIFINIIHFKMNMSDFFKDTIFIYV